MKDFCDTHAYDFQGLPIDECPVCVREERDRLRALCAEAYEEVYMHEDVPRILVAKLGLAGQGEIKS